MQPRLKRNVTEAMVAGVCSGLAEYFNIDPVIVRLIFVLVTFTSGLGALVYLILWILMPKDPAPREVRQGDQGDPSATGATFRRYHGAEAAVAQSGEGGQASAYPQSPSIDNSQAIGALPLKQRRQRWRTLGVILIGIGTLALLDQLGVDMSLAFPALLIAVGAILILRQR